MKNTVCTIIFLLSTASGFTAEEGVPPLKDLALEKGERSFVLEDGEATINDALIKRIAVGRDKVTASYRNKGTESKRPKYTIRLYNQYGFLLGEDTVGRSIKIFGGVGLIRPGDVATEDLRIKWLPLDRITEKSEIMLPEDWQTVKWVVISESNTIPSETVDSDN